MMKKAPVKDRLHGLHKLPCALYPVWSSSSWALHRIVAGLNPEVYPVTPGILHRNRYLLMIESTRPKTPTWIEYPSSWSRQYPEYTFSMSVKTSSAKECVRSRMKAPVQPRPLHFRGSLTVRNAKDGITAELATKGQPLVCKTVL